MLPRFAGIPAKVDPIDGSSGHQTGVSPQRDRPHILLKSWQVGPSSAIIGGSENSRVARIIAREANEINAWIVGIDEERMQRGSEFGREGDSLPRPAIVI